MLKKIWMPFLALAIFGCSSDNNVVENKTNITNSEQFAMFRTSSILSPNEFAYQHLLIVKEMGEIVAQEIENGLEFDVDTKDLIDLSSATDTYNFFTLNGMSAINSERMVDLFKLDVENYESLLLNDKDFADLSNVAKEAVILNSILDAKISNPLLFPPANNEPDADKAANCHRIRLNQIHDCTDDFGTTLIGAILLAPVTGGWGTAVGFGIGIYNVLQCEKRAQRDYKLCIKN